MATTTDCAELTRLILRIERHLSTQAHLRTVLTTSEIAVARDREELRTVRARIKRLRRST
jgi:hypothetical protein